MLGKHRTGQPDYPDPTSSQKWIFLLVLERNTHRAYSFGDKGLKEMHQIQIGAQHG
jgi:hypothetical protein